MATQENIQDLIKFRNARLKEASEARDADALMKWQTADTTFTDKGARISHCWWVWMHDFLVCTFETRLLIVTSERH